MMQLSRPASPPKADALVEGSAPHRDPSHPSIELANMNGEIDYNSSSGSGSEEEGEGGAANGESDRDTFDEGPRRSSIDNAAIESKRMRQRQLSIKRHGGH